MAELKKSPSKIPRFKGSVKQLDKENIAVKSPVQRRTKKVLTTASSITVKDIKTLPKPTVTQKVKKSPFLITQANGKAAAYDFQAKNLATLQDRRGISEIRRSERELRLTMNKKDQEISVLQENVDILTHSNEAKDKELSVMSQNILSLQERIATIEHENTLQAEKLDDLNICPVTRNKLVCTNGHSAVLGNVKEDSQPIGDLLEKIKRIKIPNKE